MDQPAGKDAAERDPVDRREFLEKSGEHGNMKAVRREV